MIICILARYESAAPAAKLGILTKPLPTQIYGRCSRRRISLGTRGSADLVLALLVPAIRELLEGASDEREHSLDLTALRVRRHIIRNLSMPELGPDYLGERLAVSKTQLHRYFAKDGGVTAWIRTMRLRRCFADLATPPAE